MEPVATQVVTHVANAPMGWPTAIVLVVLIVVFGILGWKFLDS